MPGAVHSVSHMRPAEARLVHALRRGDR
jgi:hypothetical protein